MIWDTQQELLFRAYRIVRLIKPIGIDACAEQIRALFRQEQITEFGNVTLAFGTELEIDQRCHLITVDEKQILLMPTEFELLHHMAERPGQVFSNEQLYTHIGGDVPDLVIEKNGNCAFIKFAEITCGCWENVYPECKGRWLQICPTSRGTA